VAGSRRKPIWSRLPNFRNGGLNITISERWSSTVLFDGVRVHPLLNFSFGGHQLGVIFERGRNPGASYSISF
jgi:hypothetical protein